MRLRFGESEFDPERRAVLRLGREVHLTPKAYRLLEILIEQRPRPVAKSELLAALWPDTFVTEGSLSNLVFELRTALGDRRGGSRHVRTVHSFGYAFCAEAVPVPSLDAAVPLRLPCRLVTRVGTFDLGEGESFIGREESCRVWIPSSTVSRRHARIVLSGGRAVIEDLGSKNGTAVGGRRVERPTPLADGDVIQVGGERLVYRDRSELTTTDSLDLERRA